MIDYSPNIISLLTWNTVVGADKTFLQGIFERPA
jgi:hypothetical protein